MAISTLTSKGQVTIPKQVRERLALREGDRLVFRIDDHGDLVVRPAAGASLGRLPGLLQHLAKERPVSAEEMRAALRRRAKAKHGRDAAG